jgi:glucose-6-phosphate isomerase
VIAQDLSLAFAGAKLGREAHDRALALARPILASLRETVSAGAFPYASILDRHDDLEAAKPVVAGLLDGADDLCLLGTGGSSLGAQAIAQLTGWRTPAFSPAPGKPRFHFFDNLDGRSFAAALERLDLTRTKFVAVSKSGETAETLMQVLAVATALKGDAAALRSRLAIITEPRDNPMRRFAAEAGCPVLGHPTDIGGRYSVLTLVGMLPAMLMGLDPAAFREGARQAFAPILGGSGPEDVPSFAGAALCIAGARAGLNELVMMPYGDRLDRFAAWWRQLWAESVGKEGQGQAASAALGPVDQHSQLQLYLDGPDTRFFTLLDEPRGGEGLRTDAALAERIGVPDLGGRALGELVSAQVRATAETLAKRGRGVRMIRMERLNEENLGALFMHFMLETIAGARLMGVNPFDQPAVEEGKRLARAYLKGQM